jgi:ABC-type multidrug transport system fused ATPase/permease subunit
MREQAPLREVWRETRAMIQRVQGRYLGAAAAVILSTLITLAGPALVRYAVDSGIESRSRSTSQPSSCSRSRS